MPDNNHTVYRNSKGEVVPSVTAIINESLGWNKNILVNWARKTALSGKDPNVKKKEAADIGTLAHSMINAHLLEQEPVLQGYSDFQIEQAKNCFEAYLRWEKKHLNELVATEIKLVSDKYNYGGTADMIAVIDGNLSIVDFKSSNGVYVEHKIQVAAYKKIYEEMENKELKAYLLQLGKTDGIFHSHYLENLDLEWQVFEHCLEIYKLRRAMGY